MCTALVIGNMIGSGVFLLPASLAPYGGISIIGWLVSAGGAICLALVFADLAASIPKVGGPYAYARAGFGDLAGFWIAWSYWISIMTGNAALAVAFVSYGTVLAPALGISPALAAGAAIATVWLLTAVNALGVRKAGGLQLVTTILKALPLVAIGILGFLHFQPGHFRPFNPSGDTALGAVTATVTLTLWAFLGLESSTVPAADVENPSRTIPRATMLGTLLAAGIYIVTTVAVMGLIAPADLARSTAPFADAAGTLWGSWGRTAIAAGAAISSFGALNGWILLSGQVPRGAAEDGLLPSGFARLSRNGTPAFGLAMSSLVTTALVAMNYTRGLVGAFTFLILLATLATLLPYLISSMTAFRFAGRAAPGTNGRMRRLVVSGIGIGFSIWAITGAGRDTIVWGLVLLVVGLPVYAVMRRRTRSGYAKSRDRPWAGG